MKLRTKFSNRNLDDMFRLIYSVKLGTDAPLANHNPTIFTVPSGTEKLNKSLQVDRNS